MQPPDKSTSFLFNTSQNLFSMSHSTWMDDESPCSFPKAAGIAVAAYVIMVISILETPIRASIELGRRFITLNLCEGEHPLTAYGLEFLTQIKLAILTPFFLIGTLFSFQACFPFPPPEQLLKPSDFLDIPPEPLPKVSLPKTTVQAEVAIPHFNQRNHTNGRDKNLLAKSHPAEPEVLPPATPIALKEKTNDTNLNRVSVPQSIVAAPVDSLTTGQKIVEAASKYLNKLKWKMENGNDILFRRLASDFRLLFWKSKVTLPKYLQDRLQEKYDHARNPDSLPYQDFRIDFEAAYNTRSSYECDETELRMNCWEFCYLVLVDAGIITPQQVDHICSILEIKSRERDNHLYLPSALIRGKLADNQKITARVGAHPGDILLFAKREPQSQSEILVPRHVVISLGNDQYLELQSCEVSEDASQKVSQKTLNDEFIIYRIPCEEIAANIDRFIQENKHLLRGLPPPMSEAETVEMLRETQYKYVIADYEQLVREHA